MFIDLAHNLNQFRSEERDSPRHVPLKKRPRSSERRRESGIPGYKHHTPNGVKTAALFACDGTCNYLILPGPQSARPGFAPVCSPSLRTCTPLTKTCFTPTEY